MNVVVGDQFPMELWIGVGQIGRAGYNGELGQSTGAGET